MSATLAGVVLALLVFVVADAILRRRAHATRLAALRDEWGTFRQRDRDLTAIAALHRLADATSGAAGLDDRTWNDLNLDDVFSVLDRTESVVGQQALYARLRAAPDPGRLAALEALVTRFMENPTARVRAQVALGRLTATAGYDLASLTRPGALDTSPWHVLFPIAAATMAIIAALAFFWPGFVLLLIVGAIGSMAARANVAPSLRVVAGAFRQVSPLVTTAEALREFDSDATGSITAPLREDAGRLSALRRAASWAGRDPASATFGDLSGLVLEYLNLLLWLDANALFFGAQQLRQHAPALLRVIVAVGEVDAAIAIASYRAGTIGWTRPILRANGAAILEDIRHPLLGDAVPNSVRLEPATGLIITGSNMSGKSTFLRTIGVTTVLAQTVNTCLASRYEAPSFIVRSCIGLADDPATGRSYYLVEVESVLALVQAARTTTPHLLLFDELFRGTNAIERIAAGEAVLRALLVPDDGGAAPPHVVLAATHDQELVDLLHGVYTPFHFTDSIDADGLAFDYTLRAGAATTRNAIALLAQRGAPPSLVRDALARAAQLDRSRQLVSRG